MPTYGENTVAEHTFALILALSRNVHKGWLRTQRRGFSLAGLRGFDLRGRTLGVVGTGHIGLHVAKIGRGFGMRVGAFDPRPQPLLAEVIGFDYLSLDELVATSDIITLHAPVTPATTHLVDAELLARCKPGALLINTARGALVDTDALLAALEGGRLGGAGLDVLEGEAALTEGPAPARGHRRPGRPAHPGREPGPGRARGRGGDPAHRLRLGRGGSASRT